MIKEWSEKNKLIQTFISEEDTYIDGINLLIDLRNEMFGQIRNIVTVYPDEAFYQMPFPNANGYHSKTLAYSIWNIFRIEDIVAHILIANNEQVFAAGDYQKKIGSPIITTGNELQGEQITDFSKKLDISALFEYAKAVMNSTNKLLQDLDYESTKKKFTDSDKERIRASECVGTDDNAAWLIDYWCKKDVCGLIKMPFSRHWIMHIEAMQRIKNKLCKNARKNVDPVAYCGFSCNHCFLNEWCGSCRTAYNTCSFATLYIDRKCPNVVCCQENNLDGCYECPELEICEKGFYAPDNDGANAAKAQAMFIKKYGKTAFLKVHDKLHERYDFSKTQEILGQNMYEGLKILEHEYRNLDT